jgi:hypothetical protein
MVDTIPEDDYDSSAACALACDDALDDCLNKGKSAERCEAAYRTCSDECDRTTDIEEP